MLLEARGVTLAEVEAALAKRTAQIRPRGEGVARRRKIEWNSAPTRCFSPYRTFSRARMGGAARRHADDADLGRGRRGCARCTTGSTWRRSRRSICRCRACCRSTWRRRSGCSSRSSASSAPRTPRCLTSSASPARSRSASRPPRACCRRCWRAGRTCRRSISSPPTAFSIPTRCSSAKG